MASLLNIRQDIEMLERAPVDRWRGEYVLDLLSSMADRIDQLERSRAEEILSPLCLPISPSGHLIYLGFPRQDATTNDSFAP